MTKPKKWCWNFFDTVEDDNQKCQFCNCVLAPNATRLAEHLLSDYRKGLIPENSNCVRMLHREQLFTQPKITPNPVLRKTLNSESKLKPNDNLCSVANYYLVLAIVCGFVSFSFVANIHFINFCHSLNPRYSLPSRVELSTNLLGFVYDDIKRKVDLRVADAQRLVLTSDEWTSVAHHSYINYLVYLDGVPFLYLSQNITAMQKTGENLDALLTDVVKKLGPNRVVGVICDNAANIQKGLRLLQEKYPHIFVVGCSSHWGNLAMKEIGENRHVATILVEAKAIVNYFRRSSMAMEILRQFQKQYRVKGRKAPTLYADTRWTSMLAMLDFLQVNAESLKSCVGNSWIEANMDESIRQSILSKSFWRKIHALHEIADGVTTFVNIAQSDSPNLSRMYAEWANLKLSLLSKFISPEDKWLHDILDSRSSHFNDGIFLFAYHVDPAHVNKPIQPHLNEIISWLKTMYSSAESGVIVAELINFKSKKEVFHDEVLWASCALLSPLVWWDTLVPQNPLKALAVSVMSMPASSAASERAWSVFGLLCPKLRNALLPEKLMMMVYIAFNYPKLQGKSHSAVELMDLLLEVPLDNNNSDSNTSTVRDFLLKNNLFDQLAASVQKTIVEVTSDDEEEEEGFAETHPAVSVTTAPAPTAPTSIVPPARTEVIFAIAESSKNSIVNPRAFAAPPIKSSNPTKKQGSLSKLYSTIGVPSKKKQSKAPKKKEPAETAQNPQ